MKCPWRNGNDLNSRFNVDCINGVIYNEYLEEFDNNEFKYFNSICNQFGVENYGEDNNPWTSRVY